MPKICLTMPAYNEADSLPEFISELRTDFAGFGEISIFVVDDLSTDTTPEICEMLGVRSFTNDTNLGHGPTYIRALTLANTGDFDLIVATDGDGQCSAMDLLRLAQAAQDRGGIVIGHRANRREPWYRRLLSVSLGLAMSRPLRKWMPDVNSPHRAFPKDHLSEYLKRFEGSELVPNIWGSYVSIREMGGSYLRVSHRDRLGRGGQGTTWGKTWEIPLPPTRLLRFTFRAMREVLGKFASHR